MCCAHLYSIDGLLDVVSVQIRPGSPCCTGVVAGGRQACGIGRTPAKVSNTHACAVRCARHAYSTVIWAHETAGRRAGSKTTDRTAGLMAHKLQLLQAQALTAGAAPPVGLDLSRLSIPRPRTVALWRQQLRQRRKGAAEQAIRWWERDAGSALWGGMQADSCTGCTSLNIAATCIKSWHHC